MKKIPLMIAAVLCLAFWVSPAHAARRKPDERPRATCHVCACQRDLGCVTVRVDAETPKAEYNGKTYYFCSESCRDDFAREPEKYLKAKKEKGKKKKEGKRAARESA